MKKISIIALALAALFFVSCVPKAKALTVWTFADSVQSVYITKHISPNWSTTEKYRVNKTALQMYVTTAGVVTIIDASNAFTKLVIAYGTDSVFTGSNTRFTNVGAFTAYLQRMIAPNFLYQNITTATATLIKTGAGTLNNIVVGTIGSGGSYVNVWDGTDSTGTKIGQFACTAAGSILTNVQFKIGLYVKAANVGTLPKVTYGYR